MSRMRTTVGVMLNARVPSLPTLAGLPETPPPHSGVINQGTIGSEAGSGA